MRNHFDEQLDGLNRELITMGALCEDAISASVTALFEDDDSLVQKANDAEREIDHKEREIEGICMKLLLQQQPVARDLRTVSSALKMISDMERIGDQAADIAEMTRFVRGESAKSRIHIKDMALAAIRMVTDSVDSFVRKDLALAHAVVAADDRVDALFEEVKNELVRLIGEDSRNGEFCVDLLMIAKYLERIGDHAVNIAEWVEYSLTGEHME